MVQDIEGFTAEFRAETFVDSTEGRVLHKQQIDVVDARSNDRISLLVSELWVVSSDRRNGSVFRRRGR